MYKIAFAKILIYFIMRNFYAKLLGKIRSQPIHTIGNGCKATDLTS